VRTEQTFGRDRTVFGDFYFFGLSQHFDTDVVAVAVFSQLRNGLCPLTNNPGGRQRHKRSAFRAFRLNAIQMGHGSVAILVMLYAEFGYLPIHGFVYVFLKFFDLFYFRIARAADVDAAQVNRPATGFRSEAYTSSPMRAASKRYAAAAAKAVPDDRVSAKAFLG